MLYSSRGFLAVVLGFAVLGFAGCAQPVFHPSGTKYPAREPNCTLRVLGSHPGPGYEEIGTITIEGDRSAGAGSFDNGQDFVARVRAEVCAAGGDAVLTEVNGFGVVARGVAFKQVALTPLAGAAAADAPAPASSADSNACVPICSPGFGCVAAQCIPLCNPACAANEICGRDRLCHAAGDASPKPAP